jgi:cytosine/adenosine deaminase-related metal-dependent hydrolase
MLLTGTVVADSERVIENGAVVVTDDTITAVGTADELREQYPDRTEHSYDLLAPGMVGAHVHSVQSLGRGIADDTSLLDWLFDHVLPMEASLSPAEMRVAAELGYLELLESGVTTVVDHLSVAHAEQAFEAAEAMGIRGRLGKVLMDRDSPDDLQETTDTGLRRSEELIRQYHDPEGRLRYAVTPRFVVTCSEACLRGCRDLADRHEGVTIHTHASENRDEVATVEERTGMRNVAYLHEVGLTGEDVVLAHCVHTDDREREILAETGTNVTYCPSSNMKLASGIAPITDYRERGITVALGNDGPPCNNTLDPFTEMKQASVLQKVAGYDPEALPARAVFEMATVEGARAAGFDRVGELREGWRADVVGLTTDVTRATPLYDPLSHLVFSAHGDDVAFTMVDGAVCQRDGEIVVADADRIRREARTVADRLVADGIA